MTQTVNIEERNAIVVESLEAHLEVYRSNAAECLSKLALSNSPEMRAHWARGYADWSSKAQAVESVFGDAQDTIRYLNNGGTL